MNVMPFEMILAIRQWQCRNDETLIPSAIVEIYKRGYTQAVGVNTGVTRIVGVASITYNNQQSRTTGIVSRNAHEDPDSQRQRLYVQGMKKLNLGCTWLSSSHTGGL